MTEQEQRELIAAAQGVYGEFTFGRNFSAGSCAAAIRCASGRIYTGICIDVSCGIGFCAEHAAVAEMLKARQTQIHSVVAVAGEEIVPPCGRCRELMMQLNPGNAGAQVIVAPGVCVPLRDLLPHHWLAHVS